MPKRRDVCRTTRLASRLSIVPSPFIKESFLSPRNVGAIDKPEAFGDAASLLCGGIVQITLRIDAEKRINEARFKAIGCQSLIAAAWRLTEEIEGKTTAEAALIARPSVVVSDLPPEKLQCAALCHDALLAAITRYSDAVREEWTGEEALICSCFGVSERQVESEIGSASLRTVEEVTTACNAGAGCRSCYPLIQDILDDHWREQSLRS